MWNKSIAPTRNKYKVSDNTDDRHTKFTMEMDDKLACVFCRVHERHQYENSEKFPTFIWWEFMLMEVMRLNRWVIYTVVSIAFEGK
jgi:hypothetical protein